MPAAVASSGALTFTASTVTQTSADYSNPVCRGAKIVLTTSVIGTGSITLQAQGRDPASATYYPILVGAAVVTNTTNVYTIYPGLTAVANATVSDVLPAVWRIVVTANNSNAATYSVGFTLLP